MYTQYQKCQKPSKKTYKQLCNTHMNTVCKMPKYNNPKNCITDLAITNQKKTETTQRKVQTPIKSADKTIVHSQSCNLQSKVHQYQTMRLQTWPNGAHQQKNPKISKTFKTKN